MFEPAVPQDDHVQRKRHFIPETVQLSAKVPAAPISKRTFPRDASLYLDKAAAEGANTPRGQHEWSDAEARRRFVYPSTLEFTRPGKAWAPVGGMGGKAIPQPPASPRKLTSAGDKSASATPRGGPPSDRVMSRPHRVELSPKLQLPKKDVDVTKLMLRIEQNVKLRQARIDANAKKLDQGHTQSAKKKAEDGAESNRSTTTTEMSEFHRRLIEEPLQQRERQMRSLQEKLLNHNKTTPPRKLTSQEQRASASRLYKEGIQHQQKTMEQASKKYISDVAPKFAQLSQDELKVSSDRLFAGEQR